MQPFHLAFPVHDLDAARAFYAGVLGCAEGRSSDEWIDFDLYGHQVVAHFVKRAGADDRDAELSQGSLRNGGKDGFESKPQGQKHVGPTNAGHQHAGHNQVDNKAVPVPHFGVVLEWDAWNALADRLRAARTAFVIEPYVRFAGQVGEQATMFFLDPSGNALEFKAFRDPSQLFAK